MRALSVIIQGMSTALISIVIPVYNGAAFLSRSLGSLLAQTEGSWEAICVNDGSTDNTQELLEEWARKDDRIRVYKQGNAGVSVARNTALSHARGTHVIFLDADDSLKPTALEKIKAALKQHEHSMICFGIELVFENSNKPRKDMGVYSGVVDTKNHKREISSDIIARMHAYGVNKVYALKIIQKHNIEFPPGVPLNEDLCFFLNYAYYVDSFYCLTEPLYEYLQRNDSAVGSATKFDRPLEHYTNHITLYIPLMKKLHKMRPRSRRYSWQIGLYQRVSHEKRAIIAWMHSFNITRPELEEAMDKAAADFRKVTPYTVLFAILLKARLPRIYQFFSNLYTK